MQLPFSRLNPAFLNEQFIYIYLRKTSQIGNTFCPISLYPYIPISHRHSPAKKEKGEHLAAPAFFCKPDFLMLEEFGVGLSGAPRGIRTPDLEIRSLLLYPAELWARMRWSCEILTRQLALI